MDDGGVTTPQPFPCPNCATLLLPGVEACTHCGLRLVGPEALRLWQVNQQISALEAESVHLIEALMAPPGAVSTWAPSAPGAPASPADRSRTPRRRVSAQQLLLGLGALLLLSAAAFFLVVVWLVVGLVGQALIMAALTGTAVAGSVLATKVRLNAAAETGAVIGTGLLTLDLTAAHWLDLGGLGELAVETYWAGAGLLGAVLLLGFDRVVPRASDGAALRRVLVYRPAATAMIAVAGWSALAALDPEPVTVTGLALLLAVVSAAAAYAAYRLDVPTTSVPGLRVPLSALPLGASAAIALAVHVLTGLELGYDPSSATADRYAAFALLLIVPLAALVVARRVDLVPVAVILWLVPVMGIPVLDAPRLALVGVSVLLAAGLAAVATERSALPQRSWVTAGVIVAWAAQPVLFLLVLVVSEEGAATGRQLLDGVTDAGTAAWWVPVVPAVSWAAPTVLAALRTRSALWLALAETAVLVTVFTALRDADAEVWWPVALALVAGNLALAGLGARRGGELRLVEAVTLVFAGAWSGTAALAGASASPYQFAAALITVGILTLLYAATPGRLAFSYLGSLSIAAGSGVLMAEAEVTTIEAYTAPLALLLAVIGWVQWSRRPDLPTNVTMGPTLIVALLPSLLVAVGEGSTPRLVLVTVAATVALVAGLSQQWQAPVTVGAVVLVVVAITQGGPLMEYVRGWVILGVAGAVLLTIGVAWERAVVAGRRANAWYAALQ